MIRHCGGSIFLPERNAVALTAMFASLYEDAAVLVIDKPAGLTVVPEREAKPGASIVEQLREIRGESLFVVHRLDRDTTGVLLFARTADAHRALSLSFERRHAHKVYAALTRGAPSPHTGRIAAALHPARKGKMRPAIDGEAGALPSETQYRVEGTWSSRVGPVALVELMPRTGRQHQVRVHLRSIECPLLVDPLYGRCSALERDALGPASPPMLRTPLHARALTVPHPTHGRPLEIRAPLASDFAALRDWLETQPRSDQS